jgi:succinate-semialdehyde dehydrogenase/glutarate-semialdehyde dehydrogenase
MATKKKAAKKRRVKKEAARPKPRRKSSSKQGKKKMNVRALKAVSFPKKIQSINPYTEEVMKEFNLLSAQEIDREIVRSREALSAWRAVPIIERASYLKLLAVQLRTEKRTYAELMTKEMGKPLRESLGEIEKCAGLCDYYAEHAPKFLETERIKTEALKSYVTFEPLGIVLAIMPWNFPFWQALRFGIPAIVAGNVVALKHASNVPQTALAIEDAFKKAGFPDHVFRTLLIDAKNTLALIDEDKVDAVSLTGSNKAGEEVGAHAGAKIKKLVLELGGSDPFIVLDDADIEKAGRMAVNARMINTGQSCIAAKRFIVMEKVAAEFKNRFVARLKELKLGDPLDESTDVGTVAKPDILQALKEQLRDAKAKGAEVVQLERSFKKGLFFAPCVVYNPTKKMKVLTEEVFGPIAPIIVVKDEDEAIKAANDTEFGLGASIWSRNHARAEKLAAKLETGTIAINDMVKSDARLPFGGVKKSGFGRELSHYGLREFVNVKSVVVRE